MRWPVLSFPLRVTLMYSVFALLWILFSDTLLSTIIHNPLLLTRLQSFKGALFVLLTAALLYQMLARELRQREQAEAARQANDASFRLLFANSPLPMWVYDRETLLFLEVNRSAIQHYGYSRDEFLHMTIADIRPAEDVPRFRTHLASLPEGLRNAGIWRHRCKDGQIIDVAVRSHTLVYQGYNAAVVVIEDVTERLLIEAGLQRANRALRMLTDCTQAIVRVNDESTLLQTVCRIIVETGGYRMAWVGFAEDGVEQRVRPVAQCGDTDGYLESVRISWGDGATGGGPTGTAIRTGQPVINIITADNSAYSPWHAAATRRGYGSSIALPLTVDATTLGALNIYAGVSNAFDEKEVALLSELAADLAYGISALRTQAARSAAEQSLRTTTGILQALVAASPAAIIVMDPRGLVQLWNPAAERVFGWTAPEVLDRALPLVLQDRQEEFHHLFARALAGESMSGIEVRRARRDGALADILLSIAPLQDASRGIYGIMSVLLDITDRKRAEAALLDREQQLQTLSQRLIEAQEAERRHIARELHDEIGQTLTIVKLGVQGAARVSDMTVARGMLEECVSTIDTAIQQVRSLSLDLRPSLLDDLGLVAALRWYLDRQSQRAGCSVSLRHQGVEDRLPPALETTCFRVTQEALTNAFRHAQARHVEVRLERRGSQLHLVIADDGIGFDPQLALDHATRGQSFGLLGMHERVALVGGRMSIDSAPGRGTRVQASFSL